VVYRPITVVASGKASFDSISNHLGYRDIFFDAPLDKLWEPLRLYDPDSASRTSDWNYTTSHYASTSFKASIGLPRAGRLSNNQLELIRGQIRGAHKRGLIVRYWDTPSWPTSQRNYIWQTLLDEGADILSVDDIDAVAFSDWTN
jgi:hypothetical protein